MAAETGLSCSNMTDPMGNRVFKSSVSSVGSVVRKYIVDVASGLPTILCEIDCDIADTNRSVITKYYYANAQILEQIDINAGAASYYVHDRLGSVRVIVNDIGDVNNSYTYNPFGETIDYQQTTNNCFMFTGQWYDSEIGQYYLRARMYDPALMRFTARDPVKGKYERPLTWHQYLYCINNTINSTDKTGKMYECLLANAVLADLRAKDLDASMNYYNWSKAGVNIIEAYMNSQILGAVMMYEQLQGRIVDDIKKDMWTSVIRMFVPDKAKYVFDLAVQEFNGDGDNSDLVDLTDVMTGPPDDEPPLDPYL